MAGFRCPEKDGGEGGDLHGPLPCVVRVPRELSPPDAVSVGERDSRLQGRDGVSSRSTERLRSGERTRMTAAKPIRLVLAGNDAIVLACLEQLFALEACGSVSMAGRRG